MSSSHQPPPEEPAEAHQAVPPSIQVEVAYALPDRQWLLSVTLPSDATAAAAIDASGIRELVPDLSITADNIGIFSEKCDLDTVLRDGDRVEIYRPLLIDPKESRRLRAEAAKKP
ncbi:MAG: RnfH family protein [Wenzhouxiangellaceae bacterium]